MYIIHCLKGINLKGNFFTHSNTTLILRSSNIFATQTMAVYAPGKLYTGLQALNQIIDSIWLLSNSNQKHQIIIILILLYVYDEKKIF